MTILSAIVLLGLVLDPVGNIPLFSIVLKKVQQDRGSKRVRAIILRESLIGLGVLLLFLFTGRYALEILHVSKASLGIAGGIILLMIAIKMVFSQLDDMFANDSGDEPLIVPLAIPSIAGPSALTTVILLMAAEPTRWLDWMLALLAAWAVSTGILMNATFLSRILGRRGLQAVERLMGLLLTTIAVQMLVTGIRESFLT